jgi:hypothetical protein
MKTVQQEEARQLYFQTSKTQKEIAEAVGVTDRTIRLWIKEQAWDIMKQRALEMPSIMVDNICTQVITMQNNILETQNGMPTFEQTQIMHKLILCLIRLKNYPSSGSLIQFMQSYLDQAKGGDRDFLLNATHLANHMFKAKNINGVTPFEFEYGATPNYLNSLQNAAVPQEENNFSASPEILPAPTTESQDSQPLIEDEGNYR